jgi:hypothetical protein
MTMHLRVWRPFAGVAFLTLAACNSVPQSAIDNAYCQNMVRQAAHSASTVTAGIESLAQTRPGPRARAVADAVKATAPAMLRQTYLNCMDNRGYSVAEALAIGQLTP